MVAQLTSHISRKRLVRAICVIHSAITLKTDTSTPHGAMHKIQVGDGCSELNSCMFDDWYSGTKSKHTVGLDMEQKELTWGQEDFPFAKNRSELTFRFSEVLKRAAVHQFAMSGSFRINFWKSFKAIWNFLLLKRTRCKNQRRVHNDLQAHALIIQTLMSLIGEINAVSVRNLNFESIKTSNVLLSPWIARWLAQSWPFLQ